MPSAISLTSTYSFCLCDLSDSPAPIFTASQLILIQSDVVGDEKVAMPRASAVFCRGEPSAVALERFDRLRGISSLEHIF